MSLAQGLLKIWIIRMYTIQAICPKTPIDNCPSLYPDRPYSLFYNASSIMLHICRDLYITPRISLYATICLCPYRPLHIPRYPYAVASISKGTPVQTQNTIVLRIGTPQKKTDPDLWNLHVYVSYSLNS